MEKEKTISKSLLVSAWVLVFGALAPLLDSTMVNIAVEDLTKSMNSTLNIVQWVITGYVLVAAIAVPFSGWFINRFNGKYVYLGAEILFGLASLAAAFSWNIESLITFRLIQGFSAGLLMPLLTTLLVDAAAERGEKQLGRLISIVGLPMILGPILGPVLGGLIVQYLSWHWIFYFNVPVCIISAILLLKYLPDFKPKDLHAKFDFLGVGLLSGISGTIIYGIVQASTHESFNNPTTVRYIIVGVILIAMYVLYGFWRKDQAVLPLALFRHKNFSGATAALLLAGMVTNGPMLLLPLFFQNLRGASIVIAGLSLLPQGVGMLLARSTIGKFIDKFGARYVTISSLLITIIGTIPFIYFDQDTAYWQILAVLFVRGIGLGGVVMPLMSDVFTGLPANQTAPASIGTRIVQNVGGAIGSAFLATIIAKNMLGKTLTREHLAASYHLGFFYSTILALLVVIPALFLTNKIGKKASQ